MDLNDRAARFSHATGFCDNDNSGDTALSLKFGNGGSNITRFGSSQKNPFSDFSPVRDDGCRLVLGLGPTASACYYNVGVNMNKCSASGVTQELSSDGDAILKLGLAAETMGSFNGHDSTVTDVNQVSGDSRSFMISVIDEGSTSAKRSGGYMPSLLFAPRNADVRPETQEFSRLRNKTAPHQSQMGPEPSSHTDFSIDASSDKTTSATSSQHRSSNPKKCSFLGCMKGARGATGLCIGHGGGQRCQRLGCNKGAESSTTFCKAHGGGRRCQHLGCTKSAEGKTEFCIAHGGGKRCEFPGGCNRAARGRSGLCIRHGGGKRCKIEGCTRSAEGLAGLCISHGGGRRCEYPNCTKGAQGSTMLCKAHGGGRRCIFSGCTKGAEGSTPLCKAHGGGKRCLFEGGGICPKSVHGGTNFCVAHGGGKRCVVPGCTKSARGRTDCCVKHGGGKRCKFAECGKSAQGSTDFCKAHGGGKRCSWGDGKCEKFARGRSGLCAAHNSLSQERDINKRGLIGPGLFHGLVSTSSISDHSSSGASAVSDCLDSSERPVKLQKLIPLQVLVPPSMKSPSSNPSFPSSEKPEEDRNAFSIGNGSNQFEFSVPEERVHGGRLLSLLGGSFNNSIDGI